MKLSTICRISLFISIAISAHIVDPHDNIPTAVKFGVAQEHKHPMCQQRAHATDFAPEVDPTGEFDFIIVGGGSAGNVIAARLADASPSIKVLVLESGKNLVDDARVMDEELRGIFKTPYCVPGQTADKCPLLSLPLHFAETPFMAPYASESNSSYYYQTVPQVYANKRELNYPRGKMLGGSSASNNLVAFRGHPSDYDHWASLGLPGWSYNDLVPYMRKIETNTDYADSPVHGSNGPIHVTNVSSFFEFPVVDALLKTAWSMGYPKVEDFNKGHDYYGAGYWQQYSNPQGRRTSSYEYLRRVIKGERLCLDGYIATATQDIKDSLKAPENVNAKTENNRRPCTAKQNLHVRTSSFVTKLIFDKTGDKPRAVAVEYVNDDKFEARRLFRKQFDTEEEKTREGQEYWKPAQRPDVLNCPVREELAFDTDRVREAYIPENHYDASQLNLTVVRAKREIILTAGAVNSAQLLMLAGIGPRKHLEHGLNFKSDEILIDLPGLGRVQDHEEITVNYKLPSGKQHWGVIKDFLTETNKWIEGSPSALGSNHIPGGMDISSEGINGTEPTIHIHFLMIYFEGLDFNMWRKQDAAHRFPTGMTDFAFFTGLQHWTALIERSGTCSEGSLRLRNRNPFVQPLVDPAYGTCRFTLEELLFGIKEVRRLNSLLPEEFRSEEVFPGPEYDTDEKLINYIRNFVWGHHISATVPMGACDDINAAADNHGRIFGVEGLRIADASAFPVIPHGNILYSTYVVAERIADFIQKDNAIRVYVD